MELEETLEYSLSYVREDLALKAIEKLKELGEPYEIKGHNFYDDVSYRVRTTKYGYDELGGHLT